MKLGMKLLLLFCLIGLGLVFATAVLMFVSDKQLMTIITVQDVMVFIVPAVVAIALIYRQPWKNLALDRGPSFKALLVILAFYVVSIPAMNWLVSANEAMSLPDWMGGVEKWMRAMEDSAADTTARILDIHTIGELLVCLLVVGLMAGLSEEIFFRGALTRIMQDSRLGKHAIVWIVAIVFSAFHLQFYGFFPRMVLGLWLGYLLLWTGSLWVPIIAHTLNNSTVVLFSYLEGKGIVPADYGDTIGIPADGAFPWLAFVSLIASIAVALWASRFLTPKGESLSLR